eukprot:4582786-Pyramimonas_sp.AAC.1
MHSKTRSSHSADSDGKAAGNSVRKGEADGTPVTCWRRPRVSARTMRAVISLPLKNARSSSTAELKSSAIAVVKAFAIS